MNDSRKSNFLEAPFAARSHIESNPEDILDNANELNRSYLPVYLSGMTSFGKSIPLYSTFRSISANLGEKVFYAVEVYKDSTLAISSTRGFVKNCKCELRNVGTMEGKCQN